MKLKKVRLQKVLMAFCALSITAALLPWLDTPGRIGALACAAAVWLIKVEVHHAGRQRPDIKQPAVMLAMGLVLFVIGLAVPSPEYIWGPAEARLALLRILSMMIAYVAIPAQFCFYLCMPVKRRGRKAATMGRPAGVNLAHYKVAV
jgi:hypothetical protein